MKGWRKMNQTILESKKKQVARLNLELSNAKCAVVVTYHNLNVRDINTLRKDLKANGGKMEVAKNSLIKRAFEDEHFEKLEPLLKGPNALLTSVNATSILSSVASFTKAHKEMEVKGAIIEGTFCDAKKTLSLAHVGTKENALSMLLSALQTPVRQFAVACKAVAESGKLAN